MNRPQRLATVVLGLLLASGAPGTKAADWDAAAFESPSEARAIIADIVAVSGMVPRFTVQEADVDDAAAVIRNGRRYILYNPSYIASLKAATGSDWLATFVLAHEVGHHLQAHTLDGRGSEPQTELEAEAYAGFVLQRLGASLAETQLDQLVLGSERGSNTHPPRSQRLAAIERGWRAACAGDASCSGRTGGKPRPTPAPAPAAWPEPPPRRAPRPSPSTITDRCTIQGVPIAASSDGRGGGVRLPPLNPCRCIFDIRTPRGRACVERTGVVVGA